MHSSNPGTSQNSLISSLDNNTPDTLERLKQQSQHCNGDTHNNHLISISTQTDSNQSNTQIFTNSQEEILRLIGQHLQSVGLRYKKKNYLYFGKFCFLVTQSIALYRKVVVYLKMNKHQIFVNLLCQANGQK
jgi:hypothetical protein